MRRIFLEEDGDRKIEGEIDSLEGRAAFEEEKTVIKVAEAIIEIWEQKKEIYIWEKARQDNASTSLLLVGESHR